MVGLARALPVRALVVVGPARRDYGEPRWKGIADPRLRDVCETFARQALHAWRLTCAHPLTGAPLAITAPLPADVQGLVEAAGVPALATTGC